MQDTLYGKSAPHDSPPPSRRLSFPEILSDPLVRTVMRADGVDPAELERCLAGMAATLARTRPPFPTQSCCAAPC